MDKDVHTEHCCIHHGCKYASPRTPCTVESGEKAQSHPCEECGFIEFRQAQHLDAIREAAQAYLKDPVNAFDRPSSWGKLSTLLALATQEISEENA